MFVVLHVLPGDPALVLVSEGSASAERLASLRHEFGFDRPLYEQYVDSLTAVMRGDLGRSIRYNRPVVSLLAEFFPYTLELTLAGLGFAVVFGVALGTVAALHHNRWLDNLSMLVALYGVSVPSFWLALMMIFLFSLTLGWLPVTESAGWQRLIMPAVTLGFYSTAVISRLTRSSMLEVLHQDYITTARAKGLVERAVLGRHALRNALIPVVTIIGIELGTLLSGAVVIETVFARPGLGRFIIDSIRLKDFAPLQSTILLVACGYVLTSLAVDVLYGYLDPRIRRP